MDAFLVIDKPQGLSSQQAVTRLRRALGQAKAGHTGTLDPLATGVLAVAFGEATKVIPFLDESRKVYRVVGMLGVTTDSYDAEGRETERRSAAGISLQDLTAALPGFLGEIEQRPPPYSAIKKEGKPLYAYARSGEAVEAPVRRVHIFSLDLEGFDPPRFVLRVECSKGTYIRSLVHDLGARLGCGAHVVELRRLASGAFREAQALSLAQVEASPAAVAGHWLSIESCLRHLPGLPLESEAERARVQAGVPLHRLRQVLESNSYFNETLVLTYAGKIVALIESGAAGEFRYGRVLNR
ncbi:MAG: tRNA pseudouridine(55) synthase TruB [bacterium]